MSSRPWTAVDLPRVESIDLRQPSGLGGIGTVLEAVASDLRRLWSSALERGDFDEITRLVDASHAVHRATLALRADSMIAARPSPSSAPGILPADLSRE